MSMFAAAAKDWRGGLSNWQISFQFALEDLRDRYRRSVLGILWITLSFLLFIGIKAFIFSSMNDMSIEGFTRYLTVGFALWTLFRALIIDGASTYVQARSWILSSPLPYSNYILQTVIRAYLNFLLVGLAAVIVMVFTKTQLSAAMWTMIPAFIIYFISGLWLAAVLAPISAKFRDILYTLQTITLMLFFLTPILWVPVPGTLRGQVAFWNPFSHYLAIVREPVLNGTIPMISWIIVGTITIAGLLVGAITYSATRNRIAFWV